MSESKIKRLFTWSFPAAEKPMPEYGSKERNMFALGMFGQNLIYTLVGTYLSVFYTDVIFVPAAALLVITVISRVWDAVNDLMMGTIVDRTHSRWGKCRPYLKYAPIPIAVFTAFMFAPVRELSDGMKILFVTFTWLGWEALYTIGDIPLWGMTSLMTDNVEKRTKLVSLARIIGGASVLVTFVFSSLCDVFARMDLGLFPGACDKLGESYYSTQQGYFFTITLLCVVGAVFFKLPFIYTRERVKPAQDNEEVSFKTSIKLFFSNKYFLRTMLSQILGCARGLGMSLAVYFSTWVLSDGGNNTVWYMLFLGPFLVGNLISMATSNYFEQRFGKLRVMRFVSFTSAVPFAVMFAVMMIWGVTLPAVITVCVCQIFAGIASGFPSVYFTTMITDSIDYVEWETSRRYDGVYLSGLNFIAKFNSAVTLGITYLAFLIVNYTARIEQLTADINAGVVTSLHFAQDFPDITFVLILLISLVPAVSCILQGLPLIGYGLDDKFHNTIMNDLIERRKAASGGDEV